MWDADDWSRLAHAASVSWQILVRSDLAFCALDRICRWRKCAAGGSGSLKKGGAQGLPAAVATVHANTVRQTGLDPARTSSFGEGLANVPRKTHRHGRSYPRRD